MRTWTLDKLLYRDMAGRLLWQLLLLQTSLVWTMSVRRTDGGSRVGPWSEQLLTLVDTCWQQTPEMPSPECQALLDHLPRHIRKRYQQDWDQDRPQSTMDKLRKRTGNFIKIQAQLDRRIVLGFERGKNLFFRKHSKYH